VWIGIYQCEVGEAHTTSFHRHLSSNARPNPFKKHTNPPTLLLPTHHHNTFSSPAPPQTPLTPPPRHRHPKTIQPHRGQRTQPNRQRLLRLDRPRETAARQNDAGEQRELDAVALAVLDPIAAQGVQGADAAAGGEGGDGGGADVAGYAAGRGEGGEDVGDLVEGLGVGGVSWVVVVVFCEGGRDFTIVAFWEKFRESWS